MDHIISSGGTTQYLTTNWEEDGRQTDTQADLQLEEYKTITRHVGGQGMLAAHPIDGSVCRRTLVTIAVQVPD